MASDKSSDKLYIASTFIALVDQVRDVRKQLNGLEIGHPVLECIIGCMSGETIMIEESLSCIREYCMENRDITRRDPDLVNDINSALFATSVALSEILEKASNKSLDSTSSRSSLVSRLLMSSDAKLRKYDGMDGFLLRLLEYSSALRVLCRMIDPFERRGLDQQSLTKYKKSLISKLGMEMTRRFGTAPPPPNYIRSLWPKHSSVYPLSSDLSRYGLSQQQVHDIYQRSNQKSFVVKHALKRWILYGSEDDYRVALVFVAKNGYDIEATDQVLTILSSYGKDLYGDLLKAVKMADYKYGPVIRWLSNYLDLTGLGQHTVSTIDSPVERTIWRPLHNRIVANEFNLRAIYGALTYLRTPNTLRTSSTTDARSCWTPILYLRLWKNREHDLNKRQHDVELLRSHAIQYSVQWNFQEALLAFYDYGFDIVAFDKDLHKIDRSIKPWAFGKMLQANIRLHPMPEILSASEGMAMKMHSSWRNKGFDRMSSQCNDDLDRMLDIQTQLEAAFPASFVETNICWDWLAFNSFNLGMTLRDALRIPPGFLSWSSHDKQAYLLQATSQRYYSPSDVPRHLLFDR